MVFNDVLNNLPITVLVFKLVISFAGYVDKVTHIEEQKGTSNQSGIEKSNEITKCPWETQKGEDDVNFALDQVDQLVGARLHAAVGDGQNAAEADLEDGPYQLLSLIDIGVEEGVEAIDHKFDLQVQYLKIHLVLDLQISLHCGVERVRNSRQGPVEHQHQ